jgi:hypothetical protein
MIGSPERSRPQGSGADEHDLPAGFGEYFGAVHERRICRRIRVLNVDETPALPEAHDRSPNGEGMEIILILNCMRITPHLK